MSADLQICVKTGFTGALSLLDEMGGTFRLAFTQANTRYYCASVNLKLIPPLVVELRYCDDT